MIDCTEASELLSAYVDGETGREEADVLFDHLRQCPACRQRLAVEREVKRLVRLRHVGSPGPEDLRNRITDAIAGASNAPAGGSQARCALGTLLAVLTKPLG